MYQTESILQRATVRCHRLHASYGIGDRVIKLGKAQKAKVKVFNPADEVSMNDWVFDLLADCKFKDFDFYLNLGSLDEVK